MTTIRTTIEAIALPILESHGLTLEEFSAEPTTEIKKAAYWEISRQGILLDDCMVRTYLGVSASRLRELRRCQ